MCCSSVRLRRNRCVCLPHKFLTHTTHTHTSDTPHTHTHTCRYQARVFSGLAQTTAKPNHVAYAASVLTRCVCEVCVCVSEVCVCAAHNACASCRSNWSLYISLSLFIPFPLRLQMNQVLDAMFERKVQPGDFIIRQGDDGDNFYVIES